MSLWQSVAKTSDIAPGQAKQIVVDGQNIAVFNVDGKFCAIQDECTHAGASLADGELAGRVVTCPWHGASFDVTCGKVLAEPAYDDVKSYKVKVEGGEILIEV